MTEQAAFALRKQQAKIVSAHNSHLRAAFRRVFQGNPAAASTLRVHTEQLACTSSFHTRIFLSAHSTASLPREQNQLLTFEFASAVDSSLDHSQITAIGKALSVIDSELAMKRFLLVRDCPMYRTTLELAQALDTSVRISIAKNAASGVYSCASSVLVDEFTNESALRFLSSQEDQDFEERDERAGRYFSGSTSLFSRARLARLTSAESSVRLITSLQSPLPTTSDFLRSASSPSSLLELCQLEHSQPEQTGSDLLQTAKAALFAVQKVLQSRIGVEIERLEKEASLLLDERCLEVSTSFFLPSEAAWPQKFTGASEVACHAQLLATALSKEAAPPVYFHVKDKRYDFADMLEQNRVTMELLLRRSAPTGSSAMTCLDRAVEPGFREKSAVASESVSLSRPPANVSETSEKMSSLSPTLSNGDLEALEHWRTTLENCRLTNFNSRLMEYSIASALFEAQQILCSSYDAPSLQKRPADEGLGDLLLLQPCPEDDESQNPNSVSIRIVGGDAARMPTQNFSALANGDSVSTAAWRCVEQLAVHCQKKATGGSLSASLLSRAAYNQMTLPSPFDPPTRELLSPAKMSLFRMHWLMWVTYGDGWCVSGGRNDRQYVFAPNLCDKGPISVLFGTKTGSRGTGVGEELLCRDAAGQRRENEFLCWEDKWLSANISKLVPVPCAHPLTSRHPQIQRIPSNADDLYSGAEDNLDDAFLSTSRTVTSMTTTIVPSSRSRHVDLANSVTCPDIVLMLEEIRQHFSFPVGSLPTIKIDQHASHDVERKAIDLLSGLPGGDVVISTTIKLTWNDRLSSQAGCVDPKTIEETVGPLRLMIRAVLGLYRQAFPGRPASNFPRISVQHGQHRRIIDFLMFSWFRATPQVRTYNIPCAPLSAADASPADSKGSSRLFLARAMLFYDFWGQRLLFAETHHFAVGVAVQRLDMLAVQLNAPRDEPVKRVLRQRQRNCGDGVSAQPCSSPVMEQSDISILAEAIARYSAHSMPAVALHGDPQNLSALSESPADHLARSRCMLVVAAHCGPDIQAAVQLTEPVIFSASGQGPLQALRGVLRTAWRSLVVHHGAALANSPALMAAIKRVEADALDQSPCFERDEFPAFNPQFYTPPNLLGELLQGVCARYEAEYEVAPKGAFRCRLYLTSLAGCKLRSKEQKRGEQGLPPRFKGNNVVEHDAEEGFTIGRGEGKDKATAWQAAAAAALRANFPLQVEELQIFRDMHNLRFDPRKLAQLQTLLEKSGEIAATGDITKGICFKFIRSNGKVSERVRAPPSSPARFAYACRICCDAADNLLLNPSGPSSSPRIADSVADDELSDVDDGAAARVPQVVLFDGQGSTASAAYIAASTKMLAAARQAGQLREQMLQEQRHSETQAKLIHRQKYSEWDSRTNFSKSALHAKAGAISVVLNGDRILLELHRDLRGFDLSLDRCDRASKRTSGWTLLSVRVDGLTGPSAGAHGGSERDCFFLLMEVMRHVDNAVIKHCSARVRGELGDLLALLRQRCIKGIQSRRVRLERRIETLAREAFGCQASVTVEPSPDASEHQFLATLTLSFRACAVPTSDQTGRDRPRKGSYSSISARALFPGPIGAEGSSADGDGAGEPHRRDSRDADDSPFVDVIAARRGGHTSIAALHALYDRVATDLTPFWTF
jgi:hypothetical protein